MDLSPLVDFFRRGLKEGSPKVRQVYKALEDAGLIFRHCPLCGSGRAEPKIMLSQSSFVEPNTTYREDRLDELGLDPKLIYPIVECRDCTMVYTKFRLDPRRENIIYERIIDAKASFDKTLTIERRFFDHRDWLTILGEYKKLEPGRLDIKVADFGCGWGTLLQVAKGNGVSVVGFDVTSVKSERAAEEGVPIVGSLEHLQQKGPYDIVISSSVIEHIRDPNENVTALRSILRPRGLLFIKGIIGCAKDSMSWAKINKSYRSSGSVPKDINPWEHLNYFSLSTLSQLLEERGFFELNAKKGLWTRR